VERLLQDPARIAQAVERRTQDTTDQEATLTRDRRSFERQRAQCERDLQKWERAYLADAITLDDFKAKKADIDTRRASVEQELARLDDHARQLHQARADTASLREYCARVRAKLHRFTIDEKRLALEALDIQVTWPGPGQKLQIEGNVEVNIENNTP